MSTKLRERELGDFAWAFGNRKTAAPNLELSIFHNGRTTHDGTEEFIDLNSILRR